MEPLITASPPRPGGSDVWRSTEQAVVLPWEHMRKRPSHVYCPTTTNGERTGVTVTGFILEAALEQPAAERSGSDDEPGRNYRFRVRRDGAYTFYRICGGEDRSCGGGTTG